MSNDRIDDELRAYQADYERREAKHAKAKAEYEQSIKLQMLEHFSFFAAEYDERCSRYVTSNDPFLRAVWELARNPTQFQTRLVAKLVNEMIDEMAADRADFEDEFGGFDDE